MNASYQNSPYLASAADLPNLAPQAPYPYVPQIRLYQNWLKQNRGLVFDQYKDLWQWSKVLAKSAYLAFHYFKVWNLIITKN